MIFCLRHDTAFSICGKTTSSTATCPFYALARFQSRPKQSEGAWSGHCVYKHDHHPAVVEEGLSPTLPPLPDLAGDAQITYWRDNFET
jgi:hypothetical protein